ncbi:MAG: molybdenum cofactor guanylyltransferase [Pseudomonadota bacterium]
MASRSLLAHVIERLAPQATPLAINANGDPSRFADLALPVLPDPVAGHPGPLAGVLAGLDWAAAIEVETIVTAPADSPFLPRDLVQRLQRAAVGGLAIARDAEGRDHPVFGLWPVALRADLRAAIEGGVRKIVAWTETHGAGTAVFEDPRAFFNVNTAEDLAAARAMAE